MTRHLHVHNDKNCPKCHETFSGMTYKRHKSTCFKNLKNKTYQQQDPLNFKQNEEVDHVQISQEEGMN